MFDEVWSMKSSKALGSPSRTYSLSLSDVLEEVKVIQKIRWLIGGSLTKSEQSLFNEVFFPLFKICEKGEEEGQYWEKHVLFESPHSNFKHRQWIFKICFAWINFREKPKNSRNRKKFSTRKINPRKVFSDLTF